MQPVILRNNTADQRYELVRNDEVVAIAEYRVSGNEVTMTHTKVETENEGKGLGSELARQALDDLKARGMRIVPACHFIADYVRKNSQYAELVSPQARSGPGMA